jgi:ornithine cyclodeaminase/alanine dehydrogenase-like protein (mu-crystallin family)
MSKSRRKEIEMTRFVDNPDVEKILTISECMDALEQAYLELGHGRAINGPKFRLLTPRSTQEVPGACEPVHHVYTSLSASIAKWNVVCNRVDSDFIHYPTVNGHRREVRLPGPLNGKFCGFVKLYDSLSSEPIAIVHDGYLQKFRVAGTSGLGTKYLAKSNARVLGLIGTGWQASAAIQAHCAARKFDLVKVYSPTERIRASFAKQWADALDVDVRAVSSGEDAVRGSDVISTATNSIDPVLKTSWIEPGMFITSVKESNELEFSALERADVLVFNRSGPTWQRFAIGGVEDIPEQRNEYWGRGSKIDWKNMPVFGEIVAGLKPGRQNDDQVIVFPVNGDGVQFAAVAYRVYQLAKKLGLGKEVNTDFWLQDAKYTP